MRLRKQLCIMLIISLGGKISRADEGMWLVNNIDSHLYAQMKLKGLLLTPDQIYNPSGHSLKDAIVAIDGGSCSGSIISANGLLITNHHCAYGDVHALSTPQKNYLEDGFWAMTLEKEVPIQGKSVTFLKKVVDVTEDVLMVIDSLDKIGPRGIRFLNKVEHALAQKYGINDEVEEISLASMWRGNKYYLYFLESYEDIRLVGAPPLSIGSYGGEQDNWGWPQHKGDFAIYRVYMSKEGKPAPYSPDNIPYSTDNFLKISSKGVNEGDFTMVLGYPGSINRYAPAAEVRNKYELLNPIVSKVRRLKLETLKTNMDANPQVRLKYQDKYFSISNYCDYAKWENICIGRDNVLDVREKEEAEFEDQTLIADINRYYSSVFDISKNREFVRETMVRGSEWFLFAQRLSSMITGLKRRGITTVEISTGEVANFVKNNFKAIFLEADPMVEKEVFVAMMNCLLHEVDEKYYTSEFKECLQRYHNDISSYSNYIYAHSFMTDSTRFRTFFAQPRTMEETLADPMVELVAFQNILWFNMQENDINSQTGLTISDLKTKYVTAAYRLRLSKGLSPYPDANSTMRITYGTTGSLHPADGVHYDWLSTITGVLEKYNPLDYEFTLKPDYMQLIGRKEWGRWANSQGQLPIDFISDNDITGGNSGSAVLNGKGELVGLAFDGNRESMSSTFHFDAAKNKCVSVDIRYVLWVLENYIQADSLLKELTIM